MGEISRQPFGQTSDGEMVDLYELKNSGGMIARIMTYGGVITELHAPDAKGRLADVALGYDKLEEYTGQRNFYGALVGRYANRIAKGRFTLDGKTYELAVNNGPNHLHGGNAGFNRVVWEAVAAVYNGDKPDRIGLALTYVSKNEEEGYPGEVTVKVTYWLTDANELIIEYNAATTRPTPFNMTNHSYFNLKGQGEGEVLDHLVTINADRFTQFDETLIPTGEIKPVEGTALDFRKPTAIGARIDSDDPQIKIGHGYDHNYVLNKDKPGELSLAARVTDPASGRTMECLTTQPGMQFYVAKSKAKPAKGGKIYDGRCAFCLETQHYPDSPNHTEFPSTVLRPDQPFHSTTIYRFVTP